jgi:DeoR/GlpR family transcriptional regulator of sugar metabolism
MNKNERILLILDLLDQKETIKVSDVVDVLNVERTTIYRDFKYLIQD